MEENIYSHLKIPINNPIILEKYCQIHLYRFFTHHNTYYECDIDKIKDLLIKCSEFIDDDTIDNLINIHKLKPSDVILIDIPSLKQLFILMVKFQFLELLDLLLYHMIV